MTLHLPRLELKLGGHALLTKRLEQLGCVLVLLGLAALHHRRAPIRSLALKNERSCIFGPFFQVGLRKVANQPVQLFPGFGVPADIHEEPDNSLSLRHVLLLDMRQHARHHVMRYLTGFKHATPEAVNPAKLDDVRADFDDRLFHPNPLVPAPGLIAKLPPSALIPWARLDAHNVRRHQSAVHHQRLHELEALSPRNALLASTRSILESRTTTRFKPFQM